MTYTQRFCLFPLTSACRQKRGFPSTVLCTFAFCPKKAKSNSEVYLKMEMLVTKFSKGKYRNEGELFSEPISKDNVKLMGEMIALTGSNKQN